MKCFLYICTRKPITFNVIDSFMKSFAVCSLCDKNHNICDICDFSCNHCIKFNHDNDICSLEYQYCNELYDVDKFEVQ